NDNSCLLESVSDANKPPDTSSNKPIIDQAGKDEETKQEAIDSTNDKVTSLRDRLSLPFVVTATNVPATTRNLRRLLSRLTTVVSTDQALAWNGLQTTLSSYNTRKSRLWNNDSEDRLIQKGRILASEPNKRREEVEKQDLGYIADLKNQLAIFRDKQTQYELYLSDALQLEKQTVRVDQWTWPDVSKALSGGLAAPGIIQHLVKEISQAELMNDYIQLERLIDHPEGFIVTHLTGLLASRESALVQAEEMKSTLSIRMSELTAKTIELAGRAEELRLTNEESQQEAKQLR
ncbi:unnamed protein product, partial [Protopolystoma xenopodis]